MLEASCLRDGLERDPPATHFRTQPFPIPDALWYKLHPPESPLEKFLPPVEEVGIGWE